MIMVGDELLDLLLGIDPEGFGCDAHAWSHAMELAVTQQVGEPALLNVQRAAAEQGAWNAVYGLSALAGLETSVLIDDEGTVFIDWGTSGLVPLGEHVGALAPFRVWTHTHPRFEAYWSSTDLGSLAIGTGVVRTALVLGRNGIKRARNATFGEGGTEVLAESGPLAQWSAEEAVGWTANWEAEASA